MMKDVDRIIATHASIQNGGPGNMGLGHLTRGGVLLLCAAWELYIEEVLIETVERCIERSPSPDNLPAPVQRTISDYVRSSKHNLKPLAMAGDGWKTIYLEIAREWVVALNTPKKHNIDQGFHSIVGIADLSNCWTLGPAAINNFVEARGDVAHRGSDAGNIHMNVLRDTYKVQVTRCAIETDNALTTFVRGAFVPHSYPWNRKALPD
ncbi:HEPN domain-containing protein [Agrobacterium vitis]|nr:HEPN domain-containing protein [Agrobacterium vitis]